jgi:NAD(P)-dependent dehydrogenase (short-subunit alcohol dehydrogenase family)
MPVTVVTGATGALGSVLVRALCGRGHRVAALGTASSGARLEALADVPGCTPLALDLISGWSEGLPRVRAAVGEPDGAVLVAGGWRGGAPLHEEAGDDTWGAMIESNLTTAHRTMRALLPGMVAQGGGSVVVIGSRAVERPWTSKGASAYAASKAAVVALAQTVAAEVLAHGVRVNAVLPSTIDTAANRASMPKADASAWVTPESLAAVIAFLLSDEARDVSGAAIPVYGRA